MQQERQFITLHTLKYGESGLIINGYSREVGRESYLLRGLSKKREANVYNTLHHLSIIEGEIYNNNKSSLSLIKEITPQQRLDSIRGNIYKANIALFISELIHKSIREEEPNENLYQFFKSAILILDSTEQGYSNFHLFFITKFSTFLGFKIKNNYTTERRYFDIQSAQFTENRENSMQTMNVDESFLLYKIIGGTLEDIFAIKCNGAIRSSFTNSMIGYLSYHLGLPLELKSLSILQEIFD